MSTKTVKLREILEVQNGFAFKTEFFNEADGLPLIRIRDLGTDSTKTHYSGEYRDEFIVAPGDYLIGMDGSFHCRRWAGPRALLNQRVCRLRNFVPEVLPEYLFFGIQPKLDAIEASTAFATVKHISAKQILDIEFPLPPLPEQHRIVDLLSRAEGIVRLRREAEKKAAELIPALFLDMFGDPATNPKGWPMAPVSEAIAAADYGSSTKSSDDGSGLPIIRMGNVDYAGTLNLSNLKHVNLPAEEIEKYRLHEGDILFNRTNSKELVGKTGLWDDTRDAIVASYFIRVRVQRDKLNPRYFWAFMNSRHMKRVLFETSRGAIGQANINSKELKAFKVALPPLTLQQDFAGKIEQVRSIQSQQSTAGATAQATFDAMLAHTFSNAIQG